MEERLKKMEEDVQRSKEAAVAKPAKWARLGKGYKLVNFFSRRGTLANQQGLQSSLLACKKKVKNPPGRTTAEQSVLQME